MKIRLSVLGANLLGKTSGRRDFLRICSMLEGAVAGDLALLDFKGVKIVNGSWLNMAIAPLFHWAGQTQNDVFPILVSFPSEWLDELELVGQVNEQCFPLADNCTDPVKRLRLIGPLDESLRSTLKYLAKVESTTGAALARHSPAAGIQATAWNNRLKLLYDMRLLMRRRNGREQIYSPLAEEIEISG